MCLIDPSISGGQSFHAHRSVIGTDSQGAPLPLTHLLCSPHAPQVSVGPPCCLAFTGPNYCPGRCCSRLLFPCLRPSSDQIGRSSSAHIRHGTARCSPSSSGLNTQSHQGGRRTGGYLGTTGLSLCFCSWTLNLDPPVESARSSCSPPVIDSLWVPLSLFSHSVLLLINR